MKKGVFFLVNYSKALEKASRHHKLNKSLDRTKSSFVVKKSKSKKISKRESLYKKLTGIGGHNFFYDLSTLIDQFKYRMSYARTMSISFLIEIRMSYL